MQTAVQVDFHGMQPIPTLRPAIEQHLKALEQRFGGISVCRVVLKRPGNGHHDGEPYEVSIRAVGRARRLLQDQVGRRQEYAHGR